MLWHPFGSFFSVWLKLCYLLWLKFFCRTVSVHACGRVVFGLSPINIIAARLIWATQFRLQHKKLDIRIQFCSVIGRYRCCSAAPKALTLAVRLGDLWRSRTQPTTKMITDSCIADLKPEPTKHPKCFLFEKLVLQCSGAKIWRSSALSESPKLN